MSKVLIEIEVDNAAFGDTQPECSMEVVRILRQYCDNVDDSSQYGLKTVLRDKFGNTVGRVEVQS